MRFSKTDNIYKIIRITDSQDNILGISFGKDDIEVIEWNFNNIDKSRIRTSKEEVLEQVQQTLLENTDNLAKVTFRSEMKEKTKIQIQFAGKSAKKFYQLITLKKVNWNIFKKYQVTISRFDICYVRTHSDYFSDEELNQFFSACQQKLLPIISVTSVLVSKTVNY